MTQEEKDKLSNLSKKIEDLHSAFINIMNVNNEIIDTTIELKDSMITVLNRLNEVELCVEDNQTKPLVKPFIERRRKGMVIETPYPQQEGRIKKVWRRFISNAST